jgi:hypothetical protein
VLLAGCSDSVAGEPPGDLPVLGAASMQHDSATSAFHRDLEDWAARAGRPSSAEALVGSMYLRSSRYHDLPPAADTGLEADYQRLEVRFARLLSTGDSLGRIADSVHDELLDWAGREATPAPDQTTMLRSPIFPPPPDHPGRVSVIPLVKCALVTVSVLPSKEGVRICVAKQKICSRMPGDSWGDAWWAVTCIQSCFDYIGWVPEGGGFTIGAQ